MLRRAVNDTAQSLAAVARNPALRSMELALAGSMIGDWAYATAVTVWAFNVGGAKAVGLWAGIRLLLMAVISPVGAVLADRASRKLVLVTSDLTRVVLIVLATVCLFAATPAWPIFVLATLASLVGCVFRPAQTAWMPTLAERPEELTAANGTSSTIESLAFFVGPAIGAALVATIDIETVFLVNAATFVLSALLVWRIRPHRRVDAGPAAAEAEDEEKTGLLREMSGGFVHVAHDRDLLMLLYIVCVQTLVAGATVVYTVIFAVDLLGTGPAGVGYIDSVFGVGAIMGGLFAIARARRSRLAGDLAFGTMLWSFPLLLVVAWPSPATVFLSAVIMGFGNPLVDVNFTTLIQRLVPDSLLGRVFGAFEGALIASMAIGSAAMPFAIEHFGLRPSLAVLAAIVGLPVIGFLRRCRVLDDRLRAPEGTGLLLGVAMFGPLARPVVESLAAHLVREDAAAGEVILREGEESDRFLVIESGSVEVTQAGRTLRVEGPGEFFGEIGLLRDVPRTATVTALEPTVLRSLGRADFLAAVSGSEESRLAADDIVRRRFG